MADAVLSVRRAVGMVLLLGAVHAAQVPSLLNQDGTNVTLGKHQDCYPEYYDIRCPDDSRVAPLAYVFGMKPPDLQNQYKCDAASFESYPKVCCQMNPTTDCIMRGYEGFADLVNTCRGKSECPHIRTPRISWNKDTPEQCRYIDQSDSASSLTTQYAITYYACVPVEYMQPLCSNAVHWGKSLHIASAAYTNPEAGFPAQPFACICRIQAREGFSGASVISVKAIDLTLCVGKGSCNQSASFLVNGTENKTVSGGSGEWNSLKEVYSTSSPDMELRVSVVDTTLAYSVWLYVEAGGADLLVTCMQTSLTSSPVDLTFPASLPSMKPQTTVTPTPSLGVPIPSLVNPDGTNVTLGWHHDCFPETYNIHCPDDCRVAPVAYVFGMKPPDLQIQQNCDKGNFGSFPKVCCQINQTTDCIMRGYEGFADLVNTCRGKSECSQIKTPRMPLTKDSPEQCRYINRSDSESSLTTQYAITYYACVPVDYMQPLCAYTMLRGKSLHIASAAYMNPEAGLPAKPLACTCRIQAREGFSGASVISVKAIDLTLCGGKGNCNQSASFLVGGHVSQLVSGGSGEWNSLKEVYSTSNADMDLRVSVVDTTLAYSVWLYVEAGGADLVVRCLQHPVDSLPPPLPLPKSVPLPVRHTHVPTRLGSRTTKMPAEFTSPAWHDTPKYRPNRPGESSEEGSLPVAAYVAMGGGGVGFLVVLVTGFCLWIKCKRRGMKSKLRKNISANSVATWGAPSTVSTHYQRQASEQAMDWRRHAKARSSDVDSAIETGSVATGVTHSPSTIISPDDSVSQVLRDKNTGAGACRERQKLMQLLKQKIREKPHLEAQIINIPESFYENKRDFPKDRQKRIEDVLECFSTDTLVQTLHEFNKQ